MTYRIFGSDLSPYSIKVRSYFRYKGLTHEWVARTEATEEEFQRYARLSMLPLVVTPGGEGLQDSTAIIEATEDCEAGPSVRPDDPALNFLSALLEDYADEWAYKWMFHYRWSFEPDQDQAAARICRDAMPGLDEAERFEAEEMIRTRMVSRLPRIGSNLMSRGLIEASFHQGAVMLERHLEIRDYLFGGRPALADFALAGQLYEMASDPTPGAFLSANCPKVCAYIQRMETPQAGEGSFEPLESLEQSLIPFLSEEVAGLYLPWADANRRAIYEDAKDVSLNLMGEPFTQPAQKDQARAYAMLHGKYAKVKDHEALGSLLRETGIKSYFDQ